MSGGGLPPWPTHGIPLFSVTAGTPHIRPHAPPGSRSPAGPPAWGITNQEKAVTQKETARRTMSDHGHAPYAPCARSQDAVEIQDGWRTQLPAAPAAKAGIRWTMKHSRGPAQNPGKSTAAPRVGGVTNSRHKEPCGGCVRRISASKHHPHAAPPSLRCPPGDGSGPTVEGPRRPEPPCRPDGRPWGERHSKPACAPGGTLAFPRSRRGRPRAGPRGWIAETLGSGEQNPGLLFVGDPLRAKKKHPTPPRRRGYTSWRAVPVSPHHLPDAHTAKSKPPNKAQKTSGSSSHNQPIGSGRSCGMNPPPPGAPVPPTVPRRERRAAGQSPGQFPLPWFPSILATCHPHPHDSPPPPPRSSTPPRPVGRPPPALRHRPPLPGGGHPGPWNRGLRRGRGRNRRPTIGAAQDRGAIPGASAIQHRAAVPSTVIRSPPATPRQLVGQPGGGLSPGRHPPAGSAEERSPLSAGVSTAGASSSASTEGIPEEGPSGLHPLDGPPPPSVSRGGIGVHLEAGLLGQEPSQPAAHLPQGSASQPQAGADPQLRSRSCSTVKRGTRVKCLKHHPDPAQHSIRGADVEGTTWRRISPLHAGEEAPAG